MGGLHNDYFGNFGNFDDEFLNKYKKIKIKKNLYGHILLLVD
jgi:hypothetical protein